MLAHVSLERRTLDGRLFGSEVPVVQFFAVSLPIPNGRSGWRERVSCSVVCWGQPTRSQKVRWPVTCDASRPGVAKNCGGGATKGSKLN